MNSNRFVLPSIIIGLAAIIATFILANGFNNIRNNDETITATGSAKKLIVSDLAILSGTLSANASSSAEAYNQLQSQKPTLIKYLTDNGFPEEDIDFQTINTYPNYYYDENGRNRGISSYSSSQTFRLSSTNVEKIKETSIDISSLVQQGLDFRVNSPEYYYTKIGEIKIEIQAEAAKDAMTRGERIAEATGRKLGALRRARMGVIQITPENSNMVSDMGINDVSSIRKEITAVVNADFSID
ncbi:SIMPL domain-containing protein [Albibacterium indicum]|uniref:SIMPL domain-containing protein n=1 Tax=Albibacterium indicum TaxID=2292082 RepID=UPI000E49D458|nr:SIMPL domain-containing protein [Pedobacter indicus]